MDRGLKVQSKVDAWYLFKTTLTKIMDLLNYQSKEQGSGEKHYTQLRN